MKNSNLKFLRILNIIAFSVPLGFALYSIFNVEYLTIALISTMLTGAIQIVIAIFYFAFNPKSKNILIYFFGLFVFFFLVFINFSDYSFWIPVLLFIYLSYIIHIKKHHA